MLKLVLAVLGGLVIASGIVFLTDALFHALSPVPAPSSDDVGALGEYVASQPTPLLVVILLGWAAAALVGSALAARFGGRGMWPGWLVTGLFLVATASNFLMVPHPTWMVVLGGLLIAAGGLMGARQGGPRG